MKKRIRSLLLVVVLALGLCVPALAVRSENTTITYRGIKIVINDKEIVPCDGAGKTVEPFIMNSTGTTYLPLRAIAQALGLNVNWDGASSTVTLTSGGTVISGAGRPGTSKGSGKVGITYRDIRVILDGAQLNLINTAGKKVEPFILNANSSVYLPLRVIGEALGLNVSWDAAANTAILSGTVGGRAVKSVSLSAGEVHGAVGDYFRLEAYVKPDNAVNKTVSWSSTDTKVAAVNSAGIVVLKGAGTAEIVATSINGKTASCSVTVRGSSDPYDETLGYSYSEIEELDGYGIGAAAAIANAFEACSNAEKSESLSGMHINSAVSYANRAAEQLDAALAFMEKRPAIEINEGDYQDLASLVAAARSRLDEAEKLKTDSGNAAAVLGQLRTMLTEASELLDLYQKTTGEILLSFDTGAEPDDDTQ